MCGMFADVYVSNDIELPHFPSEIDRDDMVWQSKQGLDVYAGPYRITTDERLEKRQTSYREKTDEEKQTEAERWGFDSWDEYMQAYDEMDPNEDGLFPDSIDYDIDEDGYENAPPTLSPRKQTLEKEWWADVSFHGTFEFHQAIKRDPTEYEEITSPTDDKTVERPSEYALNVYLEYEGRFNEGDLDEIVFMGQRLGHTDDPIEEALRKIEEWRNWKNGKK